MAAFASTDVTYTNIINSRDARGKRRNIFRLNFGDGALTYATGGIPLDKAKMGCPNHVYLLNIYDSAGASAGYFFQYDKVAEKLLILQAPSHTHSLFLKDADQTDAAGNRVNAAAGHLGANTGSSITIAGVANTSGVGGIVNVAAGVLTEPNTVAIAAQAIHIEVVGY